MKIKVMKKDKNNEIEQFDIERKIEEYGIKYKYKKIKV